MKKTLAIALLLGTFLSIQAEVPALRTQMSLNGTWDFSPSGEEHGYPITVPDYWDAYAEFRDVDEAEYTRKVEIPTTPEWSGKELFLEFEGVNFIADVYINDQHLATHIGGWVPFRVDISKVVTPGESFTLRVNVKGGNHKPIVDDKGAPLWPVGFTGHEMRWGIVFDVWLRAYGKIGIEDAFIQPSFRKRQLKIDYSVTNYSEKSQEVLIQTRAVPRFDPENVEVQGTSSPFLIEPGETKTIQVVIDWANAHLWTPDDPYLYLLKSRLVDADTSESIIDSEQRRFGFREVWTEGNKLMFNGHPFTILGANIVQHSEFYLDQRYWYTSPGSWNQSIDRLFELNLRTVRFHMQPAPGYMLDIADERGLLVMDESTIYAREYVLESDKKLYLENAKKWIEPWVKARRNHPSIVVWNAENEMGVGWLDWMKPAELKSLGDEIRKYDTTRPVNYDGDQDVGDDMVNYHYIEVYKETVSGSVYSWADKVYPNKPTGVGEFITHYGEHGLENQWWMGTWVRGMRYTGFADIRPYRHDWAWLTSENTPRIENLKNSLSPVALFDKAYDDLGIEPLLYGNYPVLQAGDTAVRTLVLYNDAFTDTIIDVEILVKSSWVNEALSNYNGETASVQEIIAQGRRTYFVPLGTHVDIPMSFEVPALRQGIVDRLDVVLIARKKGEVVFTEKISFALRGREFSEEVSGTVELGPAHPPEY